MVSSGQMGSESGETKELHDIVVELPDEPGGATGARYFHVLVIGKSNTTTEPYNIVNEKVASELARAMGLRAPEILLYKSRVEEGEKWRCFSHFLPQSAVGETAPSGTAEQKEQYFLNNPGELEGMICFDIFACNNDRRKAGGGNLIVDNHDGSVWMIDHANALFYRNRPNAGIVAGIPRLSAIEADLSALFDKNHEFLSSLKSWESIDLWCNRIASISDYFVERTVANLPSGILDAREGEFLVDFLNKLKEKLRSIIGDNANLFPALPNSPS